MIRALSDLLVDLPVLWDLGLRITAVLGVSWLLHAAIARCNPRWRVQLWRFALVAVASVSLAMLMPKLSVNLTPAPEPPPTLSQSTMTTAVEPLQPWEQPVGILDEQPGEAFESVEPADFTATPAPFHEKRPEPTFASRLNRHAISNFSICWAMGVCLLAWRWMTAQFRIRSLLSKSAPAPKNCARLLRRVADQLDLFGDFELRLSHEIDVPFVAGLRRPIIVIPAPMAQRGFATELPAIFAHELTHIKSHDLAWMGVSQWTAILFWCHPLSWKIPTAHSMACEEVADAVAAQIVGNVQSYSGTLARVALAAVSHPPATATVSMARSSQIMSRLARLKRGLCNLPLSRRSVLLSTIFGLLTLIPLVAVKFAYAKREAGANRDESQRVLHFPSNDSVGLLSIATQKESQWWDEHFKAFDYRRDWDWKYFGPAQGDVAIPDGAVVRLEIKETGARNTSWIKKLRPDDLYEVIVVPHQQNEKSFKFGDAQLRHVAHLTGLKELFLHDVQVTGRGLSALKSLRSLEKLNIASPTLGNDGLRGIGQLKSLQVLSLGQSRWDDDGLAHLSDLNQLQEIFISFTGVPGKGFKSVVNLPKLKYIQAFHFQNVHLSFLKESKSLRALRLQGNVKITDIGLKHLAQMPQLEYIDLWNTNITDAGVKHLGPLKNLKRLNIRVNDSTKSPPKITETGLAVVAGMHSLENLDLPNMHMTDGCLAHLSGLRNLKRLWVGAWSNSPISDAGLKHLTPLKKLEVLNIGGMGITDEGISHIAQLINLKWLGLHYAHGMTNRGIGKLHALKKLRNLDLPGHRSKITISGLSQLNGLTELRTIKTYCNPPTQDEEPMDISGLPNIDNLMLTAIRDQDLACLKNCKNLRWLQIAHLKSNSDAGLAHLSGLRAMERLAIGGPGVTDQGLENLSGMEKLNSLNISGQITDAGLRRLEEFKSLEYLTVQSTENLSAKAVDRLYAALPFLRRFSINDNQAGKQARKRRPKPALKVGQAAPPFKVRTLARKELRLKDHHGKVLLLHFWSSSKRSAVAEIPKLKQGYQALSNFKDFAMISFGVDNYQQNIRQKIKQQKMNWPQVVLSRDSQVLTDYEVSANPSYVLIGRNGKILHIGGTGLEAALSSALDIGDGVAD